MTGAGKCVRTPPAHLARRERRWQLEVCPEEARQRRFDRLVRRSRPIVRRQLSLQIVSRGRRTEADGRPVGLPGAEVELHDAGPQAQVEREDPGRERVESPAVADPLRARETPHERHDVV